MSYRGLKIFIIALITGVLVHYSVAWAVLECFHTEDENETETAVSMPGLTTLLLLQIISKQASNVSALNIALNL